MTGIFDLVPRFGPIMPNSMTEQVQRLSKIFKQRVESSGSFTIEEWKLLHRLRTLIVEVLADQESSEAPQPPS